MDKILFNCKCNCNAQLLVQHDKKNNILMVDVRLDGRRRWIGVVLYKEEVKRLKQFLE